MGGKLEGTGPRDGVSGAKAGGKEIELVIESSDACPDVAVEATRRLVEQNKVDVVVGPLSGDEGLAIKNYAKQHPDVTFVNGTSGAQNTTLRDPAPNFFRYTTDGAQWMAGLGKYAAGEARLQEGRDGRRGLLVPVRPGRRLHDGVLRRRRQGPERSGFRSARRTMRRSSPRSPRTSTRCTWRSAVRTR